MKQTLLVLLCFITIGNAYSQGITLLYKGGGTGDWNDETNWIQINTPVGQTPIQRAPTEIDYVVINSTLSGISSIDFSFDSALNVGSGSSSLYQCRSMHVSNTVLSFDNPLIVDGANTINIYTTIGGFVLIDSGSNILRGNLNFFGGNTAVTDLQIINSTYGSLQSHFNGSSIGWSPTGKARFINSTLGGTSMGSNIGGKVYADSCTFNTAYFIMGDNSTDTILNCTITSLGNPYLTFHIGRNANFVSNEVNVNAVLVLDFYTSGSMLNGNVSVGGPGGPSNFTQEDPANPLPNIINGSVSIGEEANSGISGDLKISGDLNLNTSPLVIGPDTAHIFINRQDIFETGGITNYANTDSITRCDWNFCHFNLEFFGSTNSNIFWPIGMPIDTLVINKTGCAKVTFTNSIYVSGQAKIKSGQLALNPNDTIPYKLVCAGDLNIYKGGGVFMRRDANGIVANIAVAGSINDYNITTDSACAGLSNAYNGNITLYRKAQNGGNHLININSASNIGNLNLIGQTGSDFMLGNDLTVNNFNFINPAKLLLGNHNLIVNGNMSNYGTNNYIVTNGSGYLQLNNIGNTATIFPVGSSASSYTPATLNNFGATDNFSINVQPQVRSDGTSGNSYIAGVVNKTWDINKSTPGASNVNVTLQWNAADELSGFTRNMAYISHYTSGAWNNGAQMSASGSDPYSLTATGITSFSPFAVMSPSGTVPITLIDFNGKYNDNKVTLNWSTLTESNTRYFTVEKSIDAISFRSLTNITAYGNSQVKRNYNYVDEALVNDINYYRLKIISADGSYMYSKTIAISSSANNLVSAFPNPVKDELFIKLRDGLPESTIRIVDTKGSTVRRLQLKAEVTTISVDIRDLQAGVYSIIFDSGKSKQTTQFIKE